MKMNTKMRRNSQPGSTKTKSILKIKEKTNIKKKLKLNSENFLFLKYVLQTGVGFAGSKDFAIIIMVFFQSTRDLMLLHKFYKFINFISVPMLDKKIIIMI